MNFDDLVGIPYLDKGRDRRGCDCWGLLRLAFAERLGVELPDYGEAYATAADRRALAGLIAGELEPWAPVASGEVRPFDGVLLRQGRFVRHIGLVVGRGLLLHVEPGRSSAIERLSSGAIAPRLAGFYRFRGTCTQ